MGGGGEEREVVGVEEEEVEGEGEEAGRREAMQMLPRMPVRVLLAEGDDSTRQIIAALLRKCGYRVSVASDGVKAWDILKDKSYSIDLVLTEVELPLMSGFVLLSMIMEHEGCKNIPVIMMSSHDSVSMVFKCMLKGAADFLVKPLRKNELRNLWQHVWRKQIANGGADVKSAQHEENLAARLEQTAGVSKGEHLAEDVAPKVRECSEQESDAQSSCTRSELEAESKHINVVLEQNQPTGRQLSTTNHKNIHENKEAIVQTTKDNDLMPMREVDLAARRRSCSNENDSERAPRAPKLAHVIDNQPKHNMQGGADVVKRTSQGNGDKCLSIPAHQLELSLRRSDYSSLENQDKYDRRVLNHSTSSAFSLYNCRTINAADAQPCTSAPDVDLENKGGDCTAARQDKAAPSCTPIRVIPFPVPVGGITFDGQPYWNGAPMTSLFYPHSAAPVWTSNTSMWQEATSQANQSEQNDPKDGDPKEVEDTEEQPVISPSNRVQKDMLIEIPLDEQRHVSPMTGESGSSSILDSTRNTLSSSGCDSSSNRITGTTEPGNAFKVTIESRNPEGLCRLSQRDAALNKFRLKRKERCFEKKVRYQSRKLLAEQRPRVKGQFVRQDHNVQGS